MPETINFNGKDIEVKHKLTFGDVRKFQKSMGSLLGMDQKIKNASDDELINITSEGLKSTEEQMDLVSNTIIKCLGFTQEQLDSLSFPEAVVLFNEIYTVSTTIKKKLNQPYA